MTYVCYRGIEISANFQYALLSIELVMLRRALAQSPCTSRRAGTAPPGHIARSFLVQPLEVSPNKFIDGLVLDAVHLLGLGHGLVGERGDQRQGPSRTGRDHLHGPAPCHLRLVIVAAQAFAGVGTKGIGLANPANSTTSSRCRAGPVRIVRFRLRAEPSPVADGPFSAAASTQTTILPTARTTLSMAVYRRSRTPSGTSTEVPHSDGRRPSRWAGSDRHLRDHELHVRRYLISTPSPPSASDRLLLRADGVDVLLVLPQGPDEQRAQPVHAGHHPPRRWSHPVGGHDLQPEGGLGNRFELHELADAVLAALGHRRRVHSRLRFARARHRAHARADAVPPALLPRRTLDGTSPTLVPNVGPGTPVTPEVLAQKPD